LSPTATAAAKPGRPNQKQRTRKDLLDAAARLVREGRRPSLEEVAQAALVSRATAYRYFPSIEALLLEASVHVVAPDAAILAQAAPADPVARVRAVDDAFDAMIHANEAPLRLMLARILETAAGAKGTDLPARQNRRSPLIDAALEPARGDFDPEAMENLSAALAIVIGTESFVVTRDVLRLSDARAREVRAWAIEALVAAARKS
jgi:AcrR family transcriptional regulator